MMDILNEVDWDKVLLRPQRNWYAKSCAVVRETILDETGNVLEEKLARVSPVHESLNRFPPYDQVEGSSVITLDYEVGSEGVNASTSGVEVDVLKIGGWNDEMAKQKHILEFEGFTQDVSHKDREWSNTF